MVQFLTTAGVSSAIETIIRKANKKLVLVLPYLQLSQIFLERLQKADERVEEIILIYGKDKLKDNEWNKITQIKNIKIYFYKELHAKCYFNESMMVITSMNLYEHSAQNNREMGILITKNESSDSETFNEALLEINEIIDCADLKYPEYQEAIEIVKEIQQEIGYCLRCQEKIPMDRNEPYCSECYAVWLKYNNPTHMEFYCHKCGKNYKSTKIRPFCPNCYNEKNK